MRTTRILTLGLGGVLLGGLAVLGGWRLLDHRADRAAIGRLIMSQPAAPARFVPAMVAELPEPARRFFRFAIAEGTPLHTVSVVEMSGELSLGTKDDPAYQPMKAQQILAPPHGFVWQVRLRGSMPVTGSDASTPDTSWSRFRLLDAVPVARAGGDPDHRRSSFGRLVADGLIWAPAAFLPAAEAGWDQIRWEAAAPDVAAVTVRVGGLKQRAEVHLDAEGRPSRVVFQRWSNENPERVHRLQPFGGDLSAFATFDGFRLPTRAVAGNHYGTDDYHPFFLADVTDIRFPVPLGR
jgi:hypothetical protein